LFFFLKRSHCFVILNWWGTQLSQRWKAHYENGVGSVRRLDSRGSSSPGYWRMSRGTLGLSHHRLSGKKPSPVSAFFLQVAMAPNSVRRKKKNCRFPFSPQCFRRSMRFNPGCGFWAALETVFISQGRKFVTGGGGNGIGNVSLRLPCLLPAEAHTNRFGPFGRMGGIVTGASRLLSRQKRDPAVGRAYRRSTMAERGGVESRTGNRLKIT